jgi:hypothetical protein
VKPFSCATCKRLFATEEGLADHGRNKRHATTIAELVEIVKCIECGSSADLVTGERIYPHRPDLYHKRFWLCACGAYCGCHGVTTRPLGNPCGAETRRARMAAHEAFDPLWRSRQMDRRAAYSWLSLCMDLDRDKTHIGMMTAAQAWEVVRHCRERRQAA